MVKLVTGDSAEIKIDHSAGPMVVVAANRACDSER